MARARVRLIYGPKSNPRDTEAALSGIRALERFGVLVDASSVSKSALKGVRLGGYVKGAVLADAPQTLTFSAPFHRIAELLAPCKSILGVGFLTTELFSTNDNGALGRVYGVGSFLTGAFLSVSGLAELTDTAARLKAIAAIAKHEAGHLFRKQHCSSPTCVMHEKVVLVEGPRVIRINSELCLPCQDKIQLNVNMLDMRQM